MENKPPTKHKIIIPGNLPTMNEMIDASKAHWSVYRDMKEQNTQLVAMIAKRLPEIDRADLIITWYCKDRRKDKDNIAAGQKFILDGLQQSGRMKNDGWKQIGDITHRYEVDKKNPRVEVELLVG
ncbi:RusA family crossover junction endodeoxyribonuclease [Paenibacillus senegalensis]|uniref:Holliday junction resolvase n=1 Tax=Paenibacillus senegalensis TaxID=1465766 RepID=UPI00028994BC|nr:Holliday junction resolvase [Paenibacillus senegalensis]